MSLCVGFLLAEYIWNCFIYRIYPQSKNFFCMCHYRFSLRNRICSYNCVPYLGNRRRVWFNNEIFLDCLFEWGSESRWLAFSKSSYIRNTGQKIVPILETLPQEEKAGFTGKLNSYCIKLQHQDVDWCTRIWTIVIHPGCDLFNFTIANLY